MHNTLRALSLIPDSGESVMDPTNSMFRLHLQDDLLDDAEGTKTPDKGLEIVVLDTEPRKSMTIPYPPKVKLDRGVPQRVFDHTKLHIIGQGKFWTMMVDDTAGCLYIKNGKRLESGRCDIEGTRKIHSYIATLAKRGVGSRQISDLVGSLVYQGKHD